MHVDAQAQPVTGSETDVLIIGAGPTGLMLGCELARRGVDCTVVDQAGQIDRRTRAVMVHAASLEQLEDLGVREDVERRAVPQRRISFYTRDAAAFTIDFTRLDTPYSYYLNVPQPEVEEVLAETFTRLGGRLIRGLRYQAHREEGGQVIAELVGERGGVRSVSRYLVGADGAGSAVRQQLGVDFSGVTYPMSYLLAEGHPLVEPDRDESAMYVGPGGAVSLLPLPEGRIRVAGPASPELLARDATVSLDHFQSAVDQLGFGDKLRLAGAERLTQYQVHERLAGRFSVGRVALAGDAAHLNSPAGGQAMNTGFGDAAGLAWRLSHLLRDESRDLLADYARERRGFAAEVTRSTAVLGLLQDMRNAATDTQHAAIQDKLAGYAGVWSQLYAVYADERAADTGDAHEQPSTLTRGSRLPRHVPDAERFTLLLRPGQRGPADPDALGDPRVARGSLVGELTTQQAARLPDGAAAVLVRPDRHVEAVLDDVPEAPSAIDRLATDGVPA